MLDGLGRALCIPADEAGRIRASAAADAPGGGSEATPREVLAKAFFLAKGDGVLAPAERELLDKVGQAYQGSAYGPFEASFQSTRREEAETVRARYPDGARVPVFVDPEDPTRAVLRREGKSPFYTAAFLVAFAVGLAALFSYACWAGVVPFARKR